MVKFVKSGWSPNLYCVVGEGPSLYYKQNMEGDYYPAAEIIRMRTALEELSKYKIYDVSKIAKAALKANNE